MGDGDAAVYANVDSGSRWHAALALAYARDGERSVLARRTHRGPLVVQRSLYPEGERVCQSIIVHPPAGIVGGDMLQLDIDVDAGACAQITTPGAAKWYRSSGAAGRQDVAARVHAGSTLEWLPQESIVFDGAIAGLHNRVDLEGDATFIGWDVVCLGRSASGERFERGNLRQSLVVARDGVEIFVERASLAGGDALLESAVGLNGAVVFGTFIAAVSAVPDSLLAACRGIAAVDGDTGVTRMRGCVVGRYRGMSAQAARAYFVQLWCAVRPIAMRRDAVMPRIWAT